VVGVLNAELRCLIRVFPVPSPCSPRLCGFPLRLHPLPFSVFGFRVLFLIFHPPALPPRSTSRHQAGSSRMTGLRAPPWQPPPNP
jgi:hypothetical protein